jgi:pimeloyl-ACP methyl ester carboxylesterase
VRRLPLVLKLPLVLAFLYLVVVLVAFLAQDRILFPTYLVGPAKGLPPDAERLELRATDGTRLEGVRIPPAPGPRSDTLVLVFAGNASNAQGVAEQLHEIYPDREIAAFFYRGYAPSGGRTSASRLIDDAPLVYDHVAGRLRPQRIVAVGISLGSGVASALAARRPLDGLILVTPFDSLGATARQLHPWLPVSLLLRHDMRSADQLRGTRQPVAVIASGRDRLVRADRTEALRLAIPNLVFDATVPRARHDDIFFHPEFAPAMREAMRRVEAAH